MKKICCLTLFCLWFGFIKGTIPTGISPDVLVYKDWKCLVRMAGFSRTLYPVKDGQMLLLPDSLRSERMWYPQYGEHGYRCVWELRNDSLFLTKIYAEKEVPLSYVYPDKDTSRGVFADWFSRILIACTGDGMPMLLADFKNGKVNPNKHKPAYPSGPTELAGDWESVSSGDSVYAVRIRKISSEDYEGEILFSKRSGPLPKDTLCTFTGEYRYMSLYVTYHGFPHKNSRPFGSISLLMDGNMRLQIWPDRASIRCRKMRDGLSN